MKTAISLLFILFSTAAFAAANETCEDHVAAEYDRPMPKGAIVIKYAPGTSGALIVLKGEDARTVAEELLVQGKDLSEACAPDLADCTFIVLKDGTLVPIQRFQVPDEREKIKN